MLNVWEAEYTGRLTKTLEIGMGVRETCTMRLHVFASSREFNKRYYFRISHAGYWLTLSSIRFETEEEAKSAADIAAARLIRIFQECSEMKWTGA